MAPHPASEPERILDAMLEHPERAAELTAQLYAACQRRKAILVLDMCGFTRITQERGVLAFLLMIRRMRRLCEPCFERHGGELLRAEADNLFCFFDSAREAVAAAREVQAGLARANASLPADDQLLCAIGIGYGDILWLSGCNAHGNEVNLAFKLGEDVAHGGQILLTEAAFAALGEAAPCATKSEAVISGVKISYFALV
jgi:class 3 adenylate cyclase